MSLFLLMNTLYLKYDVAGWIMSTPPKVPYANAQTCGFIYTAKGLCRCDNVKHIEMGR